MPNMEVQNDFPLLRKMCSLSQISHFSQPSRRSPNMTLSRRARITKPASAQNSPSRASSRVPAPQRRRQPVAPITRPFTIHAQQLHSSQAPALAGYGNAAVNGMSMAYDQRPMTWHTPFDGEYTSLPTNTYPQLPTRHPGVSGNIYYENSAYHYGIGPTHQAGYNSYQAMAWSTAPANVSSTSQQWQNPGTSWFDSSNNDGQDGNDLPIDSLNLNQMPASNDFSQPSRTADMPIITGSSSFSSNYSGTLFPQSTSIQQQPQLVESNDDDDGEEKLVGMGLHDKTTNFEQTSLLLGASLNEHQKPFRAVSPEAKHLILTEESSPPEQVPDTVPDDGDETPVTHDIPAFSSPMNHNNYNPYHLMPPVPISEQNYQPQMYDMSGQSFFFDDGNDVGGGAWYSAQAKSLNFDGASIYPEIWTGTYGRY